MSGSRESLSTLVEEFKGFEQDVKADVLLEFADDFKAVPEAVATRPYPKQNLVPACESESYLFSQSPDGKSIEFWFAVENPQGISAMALASILRQSLHQGPIEDCANLDESIVYDFFGRGISMGKGQGLMGMVQMLRASARSLLKRDA